MPTDATPPVFRGLLVPSPRITGLWDEESTGGAAEGAQPGLAIPNKTTDLVVRASGNVDPNIDPLDIYCVRNGFPARDLGARVAIREADLDPEQEWRGSWANHLWHTRGPVAQTTVTAELRHAKPVIVSASDGLAVALAAWVDEDAGVFTVHAELKDEQGDWVGHAQVASDLPADTAPALVMLPNGKALLFVWVSGSFDMYTSEPGLSSWARTARAVTTPLDTADWTLQRVSAAYGGPGEILLMAHFYEVGVGNNALFQFASADLGSSFQLISAQDGSGTLNPDPVDDPSDQADWLQSGATPVVLGDRSGFLVVYSEPNLGPWFPTARRLGSAFSSFRPAPARYIEQIPCFNGGTDGDLAGAVDRNGTLWVYWRDPGAVDPAPTLYAAMSNDAGGRWRSAPNRDTGSAFMPRIDMNAAQQGFTRLTACWDRGQTLLLHTLEDGNPEAWRQSLFEITLGGWHAPQAPVDVTARLPGELASQAPASDWYWPFRVPNQLGLTRMSSGAFTETIGSSGGSLELTKTTGAGNYIYYQGVRDLGTGSPTDDAANLFFYGAASSEHVIGASIGVFADAQSKSAYFALNGPDGPFAVYDKSNDALLGTYAVQGNTQVCMGIRTPDRITAYCSVWVRLIGSSPGYGVWTLVVDKAVLGGSFESREPQFGILDEPPFATSGLPVGSVVYGCGWWDADAAGGGRNGSNTWGEGRLGTIDAPGELQGRALTVVPVYGLQDLYLSGFGGPAFVGDSWTHTPFFDFGKEQAVPVISRSPNQGFKGPQSSFAFDIAGAGRETWMETSVLGVHVENTNWANWEVQGYDEGIDSWVTLAVVDTRLAFGEIDFDAKGDSVILTGLLSKPTDLDVESYYIEDGEFTGGAFHILDDSEGNWVYEWNILRNTGGMLSTAYGPDETRVPRLFLDSPVASEFVGVALNGYLVPNSFTVLVRWDTAATTYRGVRVRMSNDPLSDQGGGTRVYPAKAGVVVVGSAWLFGMSWDLTKTHTVRTAVDVDQDASGQVYTRKRGPARRSLSVNWGQGGVWTRGIYELGNDPFAKFTDAAGAWPVTMLHEVPKVLENLQAQVSGPHIPIVLLQDVKPVTDPATFQVIARSHAGGNIYGHMTSEMSFSIDAGQYGRDEKFSMGFGVEEEV